jgi:P27 family predicted phage terminase small subunit
VLTGNPGKRPLNNTEPRPEAAVPSCPDELGETARREWNRLVGELASFKLLTNFDRAALAAYCGAYALWAEATEAIQKFGVMIKSPTGYPVQSPYVSVANRQAEIMMRIASEFGFTPASRSRISTHPKSERTLFDQLESYPDETGTQFAVKTTVRSPGATEEKCHLRAFLV